jgi:hypothetical protein
VFDHSAVFADTLKSMFEASAIVAHLKLVRLARAAMPEPSKSLATRVGHDGEAAAPRPAIKTDRC